ncbi:EIIBCA-Bgl [Raoultella planticola]|uniref:EIIBCA-Bgl n=1 Tax=Raoultella planticola TaxID=575 RepID=A0A485AC23_RAOPL|nr:EIIBCA-Bgl [Raoultella planticola]
MINNLTVLGQDSMLPMLLPAVMGPGRGGAGNIPAHPRCAAKSAGRLCGIPPGIFGITEPAIYGLTLPLRRPFIFGCVAGAIGGAIVGLSDSHVYSFGFANIFTLAQMIPPHGIDDTVWGGAIGIVAALVISCALTFIAGLPVSRTEAADVPLAPVSENDILARCPVPYWRWIRSPIAPSPAVCWEKAWRSFPPSAK